METVQVLPDRVREQEKGQVGEEEAVAEVAMRAIGRAQAPVEVVYALTVAKKCPTNRAHRAMESFVLSADHR